MSQSIWRCSGAHWFRWLTVWSGFLYLVMSFPEGAAESLSDVQLETPAQAQDLRPIVADTLAAGRVLVNKVAAFDFNGQHASAFGDEDLGPGDN